MQTRSSSFGTIVFEARLITLRTTALALSGFLLGACAGGDPAPSFNWDVRPILSNNCFRCHGPDEEAREAGLRLDLRETATAELPETPGKTAIVPGDPNASELIRRISATDPDIVMPPPATHLALSGEDIAVLTRWIEAGAEYQPHWSFIAPADPVVPERASDATIVNDIDRFIRARLDALGMTPAPEADRETLLHRVSFTLTGLPATPEEVAAFLADTAPNAYEKVVDRLLASSAYGEHLATEWLDAARFADSDGYLDDEYQRRLYPWRDWVIAAFNSNLPYAVFGTAQLAGDLLDDATKAERIATGFGRLHRRTAENGIIDEEYRVEYVIDRTDTVGTAFLGLSVGCARCHDHKFDPISHADYYSLTAFFNSTDDAGFYPQEKWETGPTMYLTDDATDARIAALREAVAARETAHAASLEAAATRLARVRLRTPDAATLAEVESRLRAAEQAHYSFDAARAEPARAEKYRGVAGLEPSQPLLFSPAATPGLAPAVLQAPQLQPGHRGNALWFSATNKGFLDKVDNVGRFDHPDSFSVDLWVYLDRSYEDAAVVNHSDHLRYGSGGWTVDLEQSRVKVQLVHAYPREQLTVVTTAPLPEDTWSHLTLTYDGSAKASGVALYVDGVPAQLETRRDGLTQSMLPLGLAFAGLDGFNGLAFGKRWQQSPLAGGAIDELRVFAAALSPLEVAVLHSGAAALERDDVGGLLLDHLRVNDPDVVAAKTALTAARAELNQLLTSLPEVMTMGDTAHARQAYVLTRGVYSNHGEPVTPRGLQQIFPYSADLPQDRLGLAEWLFDPGHPLTARVYANRLWQLHFGRGLVRTAEELGTQGEAPTHPELLDWLARRFIDSGWDIKALNKLIVMSATYRQDSTERPVDAVKDPMNRWLARGVARRLSAEMIRDNALAVSGLLDRTLGGPSVYPYQPPGVWEAINSYERSGPYPAPEDRPRDQHRRSLYSLVRRGAPVPSMTIFDFPRRHTAQVRRPTSSTPLQALVLLNDPQYVEASRGLAARVMRDASALDEQLEAVFRLAARRPASQAELATIRDFYTAERAAFAASPESTARYLKIGVVPADASLDAPSLAALASTANVVLNSPDSYLLR
jgi:hypothetical protein